MKSILLAAMLIFTINVNAQIADTTARKQNDVALHLKKAGRAYNQSVLVAVAGAALTAGVLSTIESGDDKTPAYLTAGIFSVLAIGFRINGNGHLIKAGKAAELSPLYTDR